MADISKVSRLVNGIHRDIDLSQNSLVVGSIKIGTSTPVEITKAIATKLIQMQSVADADGTYDTRYHTKTVLAANGGAALIGSSTGSTVESRITALEASMGSGSADGITFDPTGTSLSATDVQAMGEELDSRVQATEIVANAAIPATQKGANNGVATLDSGGKIPASQLPNSVMELQGFWDASTNTPTLADGSGNPGDVWEVETAGAVDFGSGLILFAVGDWAVYAADGKWHISLNSNEVTSVNGAKGVVVLTTNEIPEGTSLYFTSDRAKDAAGAAAAAGTGNVTMTYDSGTKAISANLDDDAVTEFKISASAVDQVTISGGSGTPLHAVAVDLVRKSMIAGESMAADQSFVVRMAMNPETSARVFKADNDASSSNKFFAVGIAKSVAGVSAGANVGVTMVGTHTLGANDTQFNAADIGLPVYLTTSGGFSVTPPTADNTAVMKVGMVEAVNRILLGIQLHGIN